MKINTKFDRNISFNLNNAFEAFVLPKNAIEEKIKESFSKPFNDFYKDKEYYNDILDYLKFGDICYFNYLYNDEGIVTNIEIKLTYMAVKNKEDFSFSIDQVDLMKILIKSLTSCKVWEEIILVKKLLGLEKNIIKFMLTSPKLIKDKAYYEKNKDLFSSAIFILFLCLDKEEHNSSLNNHSSNLNIN